MMESICIGGSFGGHVYDGTKEVVGQPGSGGALIDLLTDAVAGTDVVNSYLELCFHEIQKVGQFGIRDVHREPFSEEDVAPVESIGHVLYDF